MLELDLLAGQGVRHDPESAGRVRRAAGGRAQTGGATSRSSSWPERAAGVDGHARVHGGGLDDRAAGRGEHPEPDGLALVLPGEPDGGAAGEHHRVRGRADGVEVDVRREGPQPDGVDDDGGLQELQRLAVEDDAHVDELAAVDARHRAQRRVDEGVALRPARHGSHRSACASRASR